MIGALKRNLPWWTKIGAKLVLSRVPVSYPLWQRFGLFRHGHMDTVEYALSVFSDHVQGAGLAGRLAGKTVLELGPGDSVATALIAKAHGGQALLVDTGAHSRLDLEVYTGLADALRESGLTVPPLEGVTNLNELLEICNASYMTNGLASLRMIEDASVSFIFSQAVLEHVRKHEFLDTQRELARILETGGVCSHRVDLRDHLGGSLNNLRISERMWETSFLARSGFYTNRIDFVTMNELFRQAGFMVEVTEVRKWDKFPISRSKLAKEFQGIPSEVLNISGFCVLLRKSKVT